MGKAFVVLALILVFALGFVTFITSVISPGLSQADLRDWKKKRWPRAICGAIIATISLTIALRIILP